MKVTSLILKVLPTKTHCHNHCSRKDWIIRGALDFPLLAFGNEVLAEIGNLIKGKFYPTKSRACGFFKTTEVRCTAGAGFDFQANRCNIFECPLPLTGGKMEVQTECSVERKVYDPYHSEQRYKLHLDKNLAMFSQKEQTVLRRYLSDMEHGRNVTPPRRPRTYIHLRALVSRLRRLAQIAECKFEKSLLDLTEDEVHALFDGMRNGSIRSRETGRRYGSTKDYVKCFKAFWRWRRRAEKKNRKIRVPDICSDLSAWEEVKPSFVYFTFESLQRMVVRAKFDYQVLLLFLFDSGIRAPTEMMNVRVEDLKEEPFTGKIILNIREESSKTFGRKIRLMLCCDLLRRYVQVKGLEGSERLFQMSPSAVNQNLNSISTEVFGPHLRDLIENAGEKRKLTMYDFRHSSACFYQPRYRSEAKMKYRFGWSSSRMIRYYTHFLGMVDTISEDDMAI